MRLFRQAILIVALLQLFGCGGESKRLAEVVEVDRAGWSTPAELRLEVDDTLSRFDLRVLLRYDSYISADSVELIIHTQAPDGVMWSEHFTLVAPPSEGAVAFFEAPYRKNIRWRQMGDYKISLHPQHLYRGVSAVGINLIERE